MEIALKVLEIVAPVFLLAAVGFTWVKLGFEYRVEFVTRLAMSLAIPCLIFVSLMQTEVAPAALAALTLASLAAYAMVTLVMWGMVRFGRLDTRTLLAPLIFGNTGNLGLPLALFAFGELGLGYAVVVFAVSAVIQFTFGIWLVSGGGSLSKVVREPLVAATLLGGLFMWQGWETPQFVTNTLSLIGQMAIPMMLITLGVAVARLQIGALARPLLLSALKVSICVVCGIAAGLWFGLEPEAFGVLILQLAAPVAVTSYMLAEKYGADSESVAGLVVVSTLMSVAALPFTLAFLL
ncbi:MULTISPECIES: AEC family transporter [unclassified Marinovum]